MCWSAIEIDWLRGWAGRVWELVHGAVRRMLLWDHSVEGLCGCELAGWGGLGELFVFVLLALAYVVQHH